MAPFLLPLLEALKGLLPWEHSIVPRDKTLKKCCHPSPMFFNLSELFTMSTNNSSDFPMLILFLWRFLLESLCSNKLFFFVFLCLSLQFGGSGLPCDLIPPNDLRRVADFSVCSTIYFLLGQRDNFYAPYMLSKKPKENQNNSYVFVSLFKVEYIWLLKSYLELLLFDCTLLWLLLIHLDLFVNIFRFIYLFKINLFFLLFLSSLLH